MREIMNTVKLTETEVKFIKSACNLYNWVWDFDNFNYSDKEFKETYGVTKKQAEKMIENLYKKVSK
jgi:hypothetical protein